ncbi:MAG: hypothetical protein ACLFNM_03500 [Candidatus Woesearchaeota archaeon]
MGKKLFLGLLVIGLTIFLTACSTSIQSVQTQENINHDVVVKGTVQNVLKIGSFSGYTLADDSGSIFVASKSVPAEGETVKVKGTLQENILVGYYLEETE